jgi:hypothetical protein
VRHNAFAMSTTAQEEIAAVAARFIVEEGLEYGPAKRRAVKELGFNTRSSLPSNEQIELAVREYIDIFCADTQPMELAALRELALKWMLRVPEFRPHLSGAVWRGTATRLSDIYIQLFCDDAKSAELLLIDKGVRYEVHAVSGFKGETVDALSVRSRCEVLNEEIGVHFMVYDYNDLRGALLPDTHGRSWRGDTEAVRRLVDSMDG